MTRGTSTHSRQAFNDEVSSLGGRLHGSSGRERSSVGLTVFKGDVSRAVSLLGSAFSSARLDASELELLKGEIAADHENSAKDFEYTTLENAHFNSYRDHMLGQPIKGDADVLSNISVDDLRSFQAANYFGNNLVVVGTGNINHEEFVN